MMPDFSAVLNGFAVALTPENLLFCLVGVVLGTVIGLLPGLGAATGLAILLPLTIGLEPVGAIIMLAGVYYGTQYGGTISSVLIATPGDPGTVVTAIDGHAMAKRGRGGAALGVAAIASFVAGTITIFLLMLAAPLLASLAINFGPPEILMIVLIGLVAVSGFTAGARAKGFVAVAVGLLLSTMGMDPQSGVARFTFGDINLLSGIGFIPVTIGLFALAEVFGQIGKSRAVVGKTPWLSMYPNREELRRSRGPIVRGGLLGFILGTLPGAGATVATFISYSIEKKVSKFPGRFGKGAVEGVAGPEAANNAAVNGAFVPTLTLGIPGSAGTAILLGAFVIFGIRPGPLLMTEEPELVWGLLASFFIGNAVLLILNLPLAPLFASLLRVPYAYMYPAILLVSLLGAYSIENSMYGIWIALIFGVIGFAMKLYGYSAPALLLGLILGPLLEKNLVQSLSIADGAWSVFFTRPVSLTLFVALAAILVFPFIDKIVRGQISARRQATSFEAGSAQKNHKSPSDRVS